MKVCESVRSSTRPVSPVDRDRVADSDRLGDRKQDAGQRVGEDLARGEAEHEPEDGAGRKDPGRELVELVELRQRDADPDDDDRREDEPADQSQPRLRRHARRVVSVSEVATLVARPMTKRSTMNASANATASEISAEIQSPLESQKVSSTVSILPVFAAR